MNSLGYTTWCLPKSCDLAVLPDRMVVHAGIQTLEQMHDLKAWPLFNEQALRQCLGCYDRRHTISAIAMNLIETFGLNPGAGNRFRSEIFEWCLYVVDIAVFLNIPAVYIPSFKKNEMVDAESVTETAAFFKKLCRAVQQFPVMIASENSLSAQQQLVLAEQVGEPNFRLLLDIFNPLRWGHLVEEIILLAHCCLLDQVHIKDGVLPGFDNALLGRGQGHVADVIKQIKHAGFCNAFILENNYSVLSMAGFNADVEFLQSCLSST